MATMKAAVIKAPLQVVVEDRPYPAIQHPTDVVLKVTMAGLCGSDLHIYRGSEPIKKHDFIMGHEVLGVVEECGPDVKKFKEGDKVISPFTISCDDCFYCKKGLTSRCKQSRLFGSPLLPGLQAQYANIPLADSTLFHAPEDLDDSLLMSMADIFPTGYYVAKNACTLLNEPKSPSSIVVVIGCGPVGLCAIAAAQHFFGKVYATDPVESRREQAAKYGAIALPEDELRKAVLEATEGRGSDACLEVVGYPKAFLLALDLVRPWGAISSCGVYNDTIPMVGSQLYGKNIRMQFGRCPVRGLFAEAIEVLRESQHLFKDFVQHKVPLSQASEYYELFNANKIMKTVFLPWEDESILQS